MRRIVIIAMVLAILASGLIILFLLRGERLGLRRARAAAQNTVAVMKPPSVVQRPPAPIGSDQSKPVVASNSREAERMSSVSPSPNATPMPEIKQDQKAAPSPSPEPVNRLSYPPPPPPDQWTRLDASQRLTDARARLQPQLDAELASKDFKLGNAAFIRIFKESNELELWLRPAPRKPFGLFCNYRIAFYSGNLGPKTKEGDMQAPEGFYTVRKSQLNPASHYHLAFNVGYPNEFDLQHKRTGNLIMVHGSNLSIGCFAMTDPIIEEIYLIVEAALNKGQERVRVHVFPFRMTEARMAKARDEKSEWLDFWSNLKEGYDLFESKKLPPEVSARERRYVFESES